jgi:hypothetical protein
MHHHGKTKIAGHAIRNVVPRISVVVGTVQTPVVLQEDSPWPGGVQNHFVHALAKRRVAIRLMDNANALIAGLPVAPAIIAAVNTTGGNGAIYALLVVGTIDHTHPAFSDFGDDVVIAKRFAKHRRGLRG